MFLTSELTAGGGGRLKRERSIEKFSGNFCGIAKQCGNVNPGGYFGERRHKQTLSPERNRHGTSLQKVSFIRRERAI